MVEWVGIGLDFDFQLVVGYEFLQGVMIVFEEYDVD